MANDQETQAKNRINQIKRELQRRSLDQLIVYNPLTTPLTTVFDGFTHTISPRGEASFPRYIAEKMMREFVDYMINLDESTAVAKANKKRVDRGNQVMDPEERNTFVLTAGLLTNNEELRLKYMRMCYRGLGKEYGMDTPEIPVGVKKDRRPTDIRLLAQLDDEMGVEYPTQEEDNIDIKKEELLKEAGDEPKK